MTLRNGSKDVWMGIVKYVGSLLIGVIGATYFIGQRSDKVNRLEAWKEETAPIIKRMDATGTLSFELFHKEYERTQHRQEEELKELEKQVRQLERKSP